MEVECAVCRGTGRLDTLTTQDVLERGRVIIEEVANRHGLSVAEMIGPSRQLRLVKARQSAVKRLRGETTLTLKAIGMLLGHRDHSTVLNALYGADA